jgi:hypothetical protein
MEEVRTRVQNNILLTGDCLKTMSPGTLLSTHMSQSRQGDVDFVNKQTVHARDSRSWLTMKHR